jgi:hypothetical protein
VADQFEERVLRGEGNQAGRGRIFQPGSVRDKCAIATQAREKGSAKSAAGVHEYMYQPDRRERQDPSVAMIRCRGETRVVVHLGTNAKDHRRFCPFFHGAGRSHDGRSPPV